MKLKPNMIVVTGRPGSGKTTLAHQLSKMIYCPALCRDEFMEGYINTVRNSHGSLDNVNLTLTNAFFDIIHKTVECGISVIIEAAFQHKLWAPRLEPFLDKTNIALIICSVSPNTAQTRFVERGSLDPNRVHFHGDNISEVQTAETSKQIIMPSYTPPQLNLPTLTVDTTDGYNPNLENISDFIRRQLLSHSD